MWATLANTLGVPLIKRGFSWLIGKQEERKQAKALKAEWELTALKKSSTTLRIVSYVTIWGPLYHAYYLAMTTAEINEPKDVASAIKEVFNAFPVWYIAAAVSILLAIWGIKERDEGLVARSTADRKKARTESARALQERKNKEIPNNLP